MRALAIAFIISLFTSNLALILSPSLAPNSSEHILDNISNNRKNGESYRGNNILSVKFDTESMVYWVDSRLNYRKQVTIQELSGVYRYHYPVEFHMDFDVPAYYINPKYHSIRVYRSDNFQELICQVYNVEWYDQLNNLISSAWITIILDDLPAGETIDVFVYWSDRDIGSVDYTDEVNMISISDGLKFSTITYTITTNYSVGGKIFSVDVGETEITQGPYDEYKYSKPAHFTPIVFIGGNAYGSGFTIDGVELLRYNAHYYFVWASSNNPYYESVRVTIAGPIFIEYRIKNLELRAENTTIGFVNITYRFYRDFVSIEENVRFTTQITNAEVWLGGWEIDQEDLNRVFKKVYTDLNGTALSYPLDIPCYTQIPGRIDHYNDTLDKTPTNSLWTRFSVYNPDVRLGVGTTILSTTYQNIANIDYDSYWINEASLTDFYNGTYIGSFMAGDHTWGDDTEGWVYFYYDVERTYNFYLEYEDVGGDDEIDYIEFILYEGSGNQVGYYYYDFDDGGTYGWVNWENLDGTQANYGTWWIYWRCEGTGTWGDDVDVLVNVYSLTTAVHGDLAYDNYLLWTNRLRGDFVDGSVAKITQYLIPWHDDYESYFEDKCSQVTGAVSVSVSDELEVYYYRLTVQVIDYESKPIEHAHVVILDYYNNVICEGYTPQNGSITFMLNRSYNSYYEVKLNTSIVGPSTIYYISKDVYLPPDFSVLSGIEIVKFRAVKMYLKFVDANEVTALQNAHLTLSSNKTYVISSGITGEVSFYIAVGEWTIGPLYYRWTNVPDNFSLIDSMTHVYVKDCHGNDINNVTSACVNITGASSWIVCDHFAEEIKPGSSFSIYNGSYLETTTWGDDVLWDISWKDELGRCIDVLDSNTTCDWIAWGLYYADNDSIVIHDGAPLYFRYTYENVSEIRHVESGTVLYRIFVDTYILNGGITYYIKVTGNISNVRIPEPLYIFLVVNKIPTICSLELPPMVYWGETLPIKFHVWDTEGNVLYDVDVWLRIYDPTNNLIVDTYMAEIGGVYTYEFPCIHPPGNYSVYIDYEKPNYVGGFIRNISFRIDVRDFDIELASVYPSPVTLSSALIEVHWGNYNLTVGYIVSDALNSSIISDAEVYCELYRSEHLGEVLVSRPEVTYNASDHTYSFKLNIASLENGSYSIHLLFSREYYRSIRVKLALKILERPIVIDLASRYVKGYYNETLSNRFTIMDDISKQFLCLAPSEIVLSTVNVLTNEPIEATLIIFQNGTYLIIYPRDLLPGKYITEIRVNKINYEPKRVSFYVEVLPRRMYIDYSASVVSLTWGDSRSIYFRLYDINKGEYIYADYTDVVFVDTYGRRVYWTTLSPTRYLGSRAYVLTINSKIFRAGESYDVHIGFFKRFYENQTITLKLNINPISVEIDYPKTVICHKNPLSGSGKVNITIKLTDVSPGHGNRSFMADNVSYRVYTSENIIVDEGVMTNVGNGRYSVIIDCSKFDIGSYRIEIYVDLSNATLINAPSGKITIMLDVSYTGGNIYILGKAYPTVVLLPAIVACVLSVGVALYYAWVRIHIPWEVKYINRLIKMIDKGVKEFGIIDREDEIKGVVKELLSGVE